MLGTFERAGAEVHGKGRAGIGSQLLGCYTHTPACRRIAACLLLILGEFLVFTWRVVMWRWMMWLAGLHARQGKARAPSVNLSA